MDLDAIDIRILAAMQSDADRTNEAIAAVVGLSTSACLRRIARLKRIGAIRKLVALVDPAILGSVLTAVVTVKLARHGTEFKRGLLKRATKEPAVRQCYMVTGNVSCVLIVQVKDMEEYAALSDRLFDQDTNVEAFFTHMVMQTVKQEVGVPLAAG